MPRAFALCVRRRGPHSLLTTDGVTVYWVDQLQVGKVPVAGGSRAFVAGGLASSPFVANGIAVDDKSVYWTEVAASTIKVATPK